MPEPLQFIDLAAQRVRLGRTIDEAIARVLQHGCFIMGPEVAELERRLAEFTGASHVVTCASGTDALILPLLALGVGPGDAVFVPSFTFAATAEAVALCGATPIFIDVDARHFSLDARCLPAAIDLAERHDLRPVGVIPVDLFGHPADYPAIQAIARRSDLWVLADAAQSFGATLGGCRVGRFGIATATSFFPAKPLGCYGDGGAVFTDDEHLADVMRSLRTHGQGREKYDNVRIGINGRLDTIQAAILLRKLDIFEDELARREAVAHQYSVGLSGLVSVPTVADGNISAWAQYTISLIQRDRVAENLREKGIPTAIYYPKPLHQQVAYRGFPRSPEGLHTSVRLAEGVLSLPMHPYLRPSDQERIVEALKAVIR